VSVYLRCPLAGTWQAGRDCQPSPIVLAELYNPTTGIWSITGSQNQGRFDQTATLLPGGNVLIAGGYAGLASSELFH
jgi:hypothetical protein